VKALLWTLLLALAGQAPLPAQGLSSQKVWVFFRDKGPATREHIAEAKRIAEQRLSPRAIQRRLKVRTAATLVDETDLDVYPPYLQALRRMGLNIIVVSRWFNAASVIVQRKQVKAIRSLPFVIRVSRVRKLALPPPAPGVKELPRVSKPAAHVLDYGISLAQNELINVPALHDAGIFGEGVIVGMLDTGFSYKDHPAFSDLQVLGEHDFLFNDDSTADGPDDDPGQHNHGTQTLSIIAGHDPGNLIGPAFAAQFYLAKTEYLNREVRVEEDFWQAGIEWLEAQGADVVSSSLGYADGHDDPAEDHTWDELDGQTILVTRAAQMAVAKGVVVINAAGNEGNKAWQFVIAPADGADVIAVGAVNSSGKRVAFSSLGPTADGRIKPDVMAMGAAVTKVAMPPGQALYDSRSSGTSFSTPQVAGVAALILSAHPELTPLQVNEALRMTASQSDFPDNQMGYGIVNAEAAITYWGPAFSNRFRVEFLPGNAAIVHIGVLSSPRIDEGSATLYWRKAGDSEFAALPMRSEDATYLRSDSLYLADSRKTEIYFSVHVPGKGDFTYPHDAPANVFILEEDGDNSFPGETPPPNSFEIIGSYPNPFVLAAGNALRVQLLTSESSVVRARVYNVLGQEVARVLDHVQVPKGSSTFTWDGRSNRGTPVATGIYFYRLEFTTSLGNRFIREHKFAVIR